MSHHRTLVYLLALAVASVVSGQEVADSDAPPSRPAFRPVPPGVVEMTGMSAGGGIVALKDGSLMFAQGTSYRSSQDGGRTWGEPIEFGSPVGVSGIIRLQSGALGVYGGGAAGWSFSSSPDDGKTWTEAVEIGTYPDFYAMYHSLIQLDSGRLLLSGYWEGFNGAERGGGHRVSPTGWGLWRDRVLYMEGHRFGEMGICAAYYSDDEGKTWTKKSRVGVFGWFDEWGVHNQAGGILDLYEPTSAQTPDGRVLMFCRSKTGRIVQTYSIDGGEQWMAAEPTELASSQAPPMLVRIPKNGNLLCVWNQVSDEEIRRGFMRSRLSAAISRDGGLTWDNFRTLELAEGLEDFDRIRPTLPIPRIIVGRSPFHHLPDGFATFSYANVDIVGESVLIRYSRSWPVPRAKTQPSGHRAMNTYTWPAYEAREADFTAEAVMRIYPLKWFYEGQNRDEPTGQ